MKQKNIATILCLIAPVLIIWCTLGCRSTKPTASVYTTTDTITIIRPDTVTIAPVSISSELDFVRICDSLSRRRPVEIIRPLRSGGKITVQVDSSGRGEVICETDSLKAVIGRLEQRIRNNRMETIVQTVLAPETHAQALYRWTFWIILLVTGGYFGIRQVVKQFKVRP
jgi:hypothetical protein